jgi:hypothetical protein
MACTFYLGTHKPDWLAKTDVPLMLSRRWLAPRKTLPVALGPWALDSGGFTELNLHGEWTVSAVAYAREAERFVREIGSLCWAAQQDWMCESVVLAKTGLTVTQHQARTVANYRDLLCLAPSVPWLPVVQGYTRDEYLRCLDLYDAAGFDLRQLPAVGLGSVCRRQSTGEAVSIVRELAGLGLRLHAFGFKLQGLRAAAHLLASADSMAWSFDARRNDPLPGCPHRSCANCIRYALSWRERAVSICQDDSPRQGWLF